MAKWKTTISIKDIHEHYDQHGDVKPCGKMLAERLRKLKEEFSDLYTLRVLEAISCDFEHVEDVIHYDIYLNRLYNWADVGHRCFISPFK